MEKIKKKLPYYLLFFIVLNSAYSCKPASQTVGCDLSIDNLQEKLLSKNMDQIAFYLKNESDCFQIKDTIFEDEMQKWKVKNVSMQGMAAFFCRA